MERVVHKAKGFKEADEWDIQQQVAMTPEQRLRAAKELRDRVYPTNSKDVRACRADSTRRRRVLRRRSSLASKI
ncbi:MAG: hypothetical protein ABSH14_10985 [Verrucomicrobiia bacterium]|jgi:hypothetical protein